ncbi:MAG: helix-turn-helix transcriptional regulator [Alteromonadaceae bacterium]|nr:helix-turn-helix transcriptional regulator [Alteromonadaceae bacterium]
MDIFKALSDPTRRHIIEQLYHHGPQSIKQLGLDLPMSRQALTKHLNRLISAKIVRADFEGKEKVHRLNAKPVDELLRWLAPFAQRWDQKLNNLQTHLGTPDEQEN